MNKIKSRLDVRALKRLDGRTSTSYSSSIITKLENLKVWKCTRRMLQSICTDTSQRKAEGIALDGLINILTKMHT
ncbi:hypothetical protein JOD82_001981 [Paenibacillus sp. 1182]|uniref:hypothetical protein n=1 Tax=Paenibacillus sp. 1182 TaxID=2806565 RepID=UPI001AEA13BE|nr:hypothetical protein [Paenibacillus sp. 1182]MBP1308961.1 hypothetical protein [Paenibacillus sp. 1182]